MKNLHELIMNANARGHIGFRGEFAPCVEGPSMDDILILKALDLGLIKLISAWRSTEDDLPERWGGAIDRRVYGLTGRGWGYKVSGGTGVLPDYSEEFTAQADAAHWGKLAVLTPDLRYPETTFDDWEHPILHGNYDGNYNTPTSEHPHVVMTKDGVLHDIPYPGHKLEVPDDHWIPPRRYEVRRYEVLAWELLGICVIGAALAGAGWWLS